MSGFAHTSRPPYEANAERYVVEHGFSSDVKTSPDASPHILHAAWGKKLYVYEVLVYNHSGAFGTLHLELSDGEEKSVPIAVANNDTVVVSLAKPIVFGSNDIYYHASAAGIDIQVTGLAL
jgi:hypothetical protein